MADKAGRVRRRAGLRATPHRPRRAGAAALLGATSFGGALALTGILVAGPNADPSPTPAPAAVTAAAPSASAPPTNAPGGTPDSEALNGRAREDAELVDAPKAVAFLEAMRAADVPTSRTGVAEVMVARAACKELAAGTSESDLARRIPRGLPTVTRAQAAELVGLAQKHYC